MIQMETALDAHFGMLRFFTSTSLSGRIPKREESGTIERNSQKGKNRELSGGIPKKLA